MAELRDLLGDQKAMSEMSEDELHEMLRGIRHNRRTPPPSPAKEKKAKPSAKKEPSPEEALALLKLLGEI
jgi:hypothetical protein